MQDLELIFCLLTVAKLSDTDAVALALEPLAIKRQREFLVSRAAKLEQGREILGEVIRLRQYPTVCWISAYRIRNLRTWISELNRWISNRYPLDNKYNKYAKPRDIPVIA